MNKKWDWFYRNFFFFTIFLYNFLSVFFFWYFVLVSIIVIISLFHLFIFWHFYNFLLRQIQYFQIIFLHSFPIFFPLTIFWAKIRTMYFYFSFKCLTSKLLMSYRLSSHKELSSIIRSTPEIKEQKMSITWIMIQFNGDFRQLLLCTPQGLSYLLD